MRFLFVAVIGLTFAGACAPEDPTSYDLVIAGGRVMDPATGLDAIMNVGIEDGTIVSVSERTLDGVRVIDASNHVVSPGFIDLHQHSQDHDGYRMTVRDGVTSTFELEIGTGDVTNWYEEREGGQLVNFGVAVGHVPVRMKVLGDPGPGLMPTGVGGTGTATEEEIAEMEHLIREGLREGAVAVGFGASYTPGATIQEIERLFRVAAEAGASVHIHLRGGVSSLHETIESAKSAEAALHVVHVNSSAGNNLETFLDVIQTARDQGMDLTTEAYPYGAGMTEIQSTLYDGWEDWPDERFERYQLVSTGERATRETFEQARAEGGTVISHGRSEEQTRAAIASPLSIIASDGFLEDGKGHPRTSGTYAKVLGQYVREEGVINLMDALRRMTLEPARRLEGRTPVMAKKGRIREGADADITVFDPRTVIDRATYEDATIPSRGIPYVIVGGEVVVDGGELTDARPGQSIAAPVHPD